MKIDFYYWGIQCPINYETIKLLNKLDLNMFNINFYDITYDKALAKKMNMYFPFLTVFNAHIRLRGPINLELINKIQKGEAVKEKPYIVSIPSKVYEGQLIELTSGTIEKVNDCCTMTNCSEGCRAKGKFLSKINNEFLGYLHFKEDKIIGGAEYVPSIFVPYDIPRSQEVAFLTCSYLSSDSEFDNRAYPLRALEKELKFKFKIEEIKVEFFLIFNLL